MTLVRLEPAAPQSGVKHSTTEPMRSRLNFDGCFKNVKSFSVSEGFRSGSRICGKGFVCIKVWGFALLILSHFS